MNYLEFLKSNLILLKTFELFDDDLHKIVYSKRFKEDKVRKLTLGVEKDWMSLTDLSSNLKGVGISSLDVYFDYLSNKVLSIKLEASMDYVGYINFLLESYENDLHEAEFLNFSLLDSYSSLKVLITQTSNLSLKSTFILPTYNNSILQINYGDFKMLKYKNKFIVDSDIHEMGKSVYYDLVNNRMSFNSKLSNKDLKVKFEFLEGDDCGKFFSLLTDCPSNRLLLGYDNITYKIIINTNYLEVFKDKLKEFIDFNPSYYENITLKFIYTEEVEDEFLSLVNELEKYFKVQSVR